MWRKGLLNKPTDWQEFLPAIIEVENRPPPGLARMTVWSIFLFFVTAVTWASVGEIDVLARAAGKLVPDGEVKVIQSVDGGRVAAIYVSDGDRVQAGDALLAFDDSELLTELLSVTTAMEGARSIIGEQKRLLELVSGFSRSKSPADPPPRVPRVPRQPDHGHTDFEARAQAAFASYQARIEQVGSERLALEAALQATRHEITRLNKTLPIAAEHERSLQQLQQQKLAARVVYRQAEKQLIDEKSMLQQQRSRQTQIENEIAALAAQRESLEADFRSTALQRLDENRRQFEQLHQRESQLQKRIVHTVVRAPVNGEVQALIVHTLGGVIRPAEPLMRLVPDSAALEASVRFDDRDIGFIAENQSARIKVEAFEYSRYGAIDATVRSIAADAEASELGGLVYEARLRLHEQALNTKSTLAALSPGMSVVAEARTGTRRIISYFLSPLMRLSNESIRER